VAAFAGLMLVLSAGGCSYQLGSLLGKDGRGETTPSKETTGAIAPAATPAKSASESPSEVDIAVASAVAADAVAKSGDTSTPWENPRTGARGTVTPLASAYDQDGFVCRDFLASFVRENMESWLQGEACRLHQGKWVVRSLKPWKRA
jgi:surface antigen